jgi:hypothetical protein
VAVLQNHALGAEGGGRAEDRADVLRVGDLVQHHQQALGGGSQVVDAEGLGLVDLQGDALVHGPGRQLTGDVGALHDLQERRAAQIRRESLGAVRGGQKTFRNGSGGVGKRRLDGVSPPNPVLGVALALGKLVVFPRLGTKITSGRRRLFPVVAFGMRGHYKTRSDLGP